VNLSTRHSARITRSCGPLSASHGHRQGRALSFRCQSHLLRHIDPRATRRILLSIDLDAFTASIPVRTSIPTWEHQDRANVATTPEIHIGLTAHEEPTPPRLEVFGDDE
jgi:hypothetical protein